jgi:hypothetical protein
MFFTLNNHPWPHIKGLKPFRLLNEIREVIRKSVHHAVPWYHTVRAVLTAFEGNIYQKSTVRVHNNTSSPLQILYMYVIVTVFMA